jgi:hypothetical protein
MECQLPVFACLTKSAVTGVITSEEFALRLEHMQEAMFEHMSCQDTRVKYETHLVPILRMEIKYNPDVIPIPSDFNTLFKHFTTRRLNDRHFGVIAKTLIERYTHLVGIAAVIGANMDSVFTCPLTADPLPVEKQVPPAPQHNYLGGVRTQAQAGVGMKRKTSPSQDVPPNQRAKLDDKARREAVRAETNSRLAVAQELFKAAQAAKALAVLLKGDKP